MTITVNLNAAAGIGSTTFTEQTLVTLFSGATIAGTNNDQDSINNISVSLTNHTATQTLSLTSAAAAIATANGVTVSFNASTGVLTLSGSGGGGNESDATWQSILRGIQFNDTSNNPVNPTTITVVATNTGGSGTTGSDTHSMTVTQVNDNPVASNVTGSAGENGGSVLINASATDPDVTDTLTYTINTTGTLGSVTNNNNGTFSYNANGAFESLAAGATAQTTFTYTANDGHGGTSTATATVTITGANDAPVAANVSDNVNEDGPGIVITPSFTDVDSGDTHTFTIDTTGTLGSVTNNPNGTFTYNPNGAFENLALGETATDTFTYIVHDNHSGNSVAKTVTVTITGANDSPSASDVSAASSEDGGVLVNGTFSDIDSSDTLAFSIDTTATLGSVVNNDDGTFSYDANGAFESLAAGETAEDTFTYTVTDNNGAAGTATVTVTVTGENDDPLAADITGGVTENGGIIVLNADFSDVDASDTHTFSITTAGTVGVVVNNGDGTFNYRTAGAYDYLAAGETAEDTFTYTVDDGHGGTSTATATVTITGTNDAPVVLAISGAADENGAAIQLAADFTDVDLSNTHTFAINTTGTLGLVNNNNDGTFSYNANGAFENLAAGETATDTFTYTVTDSSGSSRTATATVTVTGENDDPIAVNVTGAAGEDGGAISISANFTDADVTDSHTYSVDTTGTLGSVTDNADGTFSYEANSAFENLAAGETAQDTFTYTVDDGNGGTSTATVTITITGENDAPVAEDVTAAAGENGAAISISANFTDVDVTDTHSYTINVTGTLGSVGNNNDGTFTYNADGEFESLGAGETAEDTFTYTVNDGHGGTSTATATVIVTGSNDAPVVSADSLPGGLSENAAVNSVAASLVITDVDLTDSVSSIVLLDDAGGRFALDGTDIIVANSILLDYEQASSHTVTVQVTDANGGVTELDVVIDLNNQTPEDVTGTADNDRIVTDSGNDTLNGAGGADTMLGGAGDDIYYIDNTGDRAVDTTTGSSGIDAGGNDTVISSIFVNMDAYAGIRVIENLTLTGSADIVGLGNALDNRMTGNTGNNVLNGETGADTMLGGAGNDIYWVDSAGDRVVETTTGSSGIDAGGVDLLQSSVFVNMDAYSGVRFVENLILIGTDNVGAKGNALNNKMNGNVGENLLDGGTGNDTMLGGAGDDTYVMDAAGDKVVETIAGNSSIDAGGNDTILSSVYTNLDGSVGIRFVENLVLTGTDSVNGKGNALDNRMTGNSGNNQLDGGTGSDTMLGGAGDDTYFVDSTGDRVIETTTAISGIDSGGNDSVRSSVTINLDAYAGVRFVEKLFLTGTGNIDGMGNDLDNFITGNDGANVLSGGAGSDRMTGGLGADSFIFDAAFAVGVFDRIVDFVAGVDHIGLDNAVFAGLSVGALAANAFVSNTTGVASSATDRVIYETDTGRLYFDADGVGGAVRVQFATLDTNLVLASTDFFVL